MIKNILFTILLHSYRESALAAQFDKGTTRKQWNNQTLHLLLSNQAEHKQRMQDNALR